MTTPQPTGKPNARMRQSVGDMVRSMAVVLAVVGAILLVTWRPDPDPVRVVDVAPLALIATAQSDFPILVPALPQLRPTSVRWQPTPESAERSVWHVGYVTEGDNYLQITQSVADNPTFLAAETDNGAVADLLVINGQDWQYFEAESGNSLLHMSDGVTTVVQGTGTRADLIAAVESLKPVTTD